MDAHCSVHTTHQPSCPLCRREAARGQVPGLMAQAGNFVVGAARQLAAGDPRVPTEERRRRLALCIVCDYYSAEDTRCLKCGCLLAWKSAWKTAKCPIGKW